MAARRGTFAFNLSKPLKKGSLLKQGALHKAFKSREFILYPGFLVYYDSENKWRLDLTKGETLGGRLGAVKLKGATVSIARNAPKGCKFGLMINAPDPANKRQVYMMNASSKEDRDQWIEAIRKATPVSPHLRRKEDKPSGNSETALKPSADSKSSVSEKEKASKDKKEELAPPSYTMRQDTACDAAVAAASCTDSSEEQRSIDQVITSVNSSLKDVDPTLIVRHNTATMAALSLSVSSQEEEGEGHPQENGLELEDEEEHETNIDSIFGKQENSSGDESASGSGMSSTSTPTYLMSPEPADATEMETTERVENGDCAPDSEGEVVITTTVTVACASNSQESSPVLRPKERGEAGEENNCGSSEEARPRTCSSKQVLLNDHEDNVTLSVNLNGYDSDDTLSDEESHANLLTLQPEDFEGEAKSNGAEAEPAKTEPPVENTSETKENGVSKSPSPPRSPVIAIKEDRSGKGSTSSKGSQSSDDTSTLSPPKDKKRSNSVPFIEKKGYLYKMGGQRKTWKLRYFVLRPGVFNYFKDGSSHKAIGEVKLKNLSIFFPGIGERKQSFQFTVHTESTWNKRANWVFAGQSEREMKEWITAFKVAGQKVTSLSPHDSDSG